MAGLFGGGKAKTPAAPRPVRQPTPEDPSMRAAAERARMDAMRRSGRLSTILTDQTQQTLGANPGASTDQAYG